MENKVEQLNNQIRPLAVKFKKLKAKRKKQRQDCKHQFEITHYHSLEDDEGNDAVEVAVHCELCGTFAECTGTLAYEDAQGF